jgi:hypothetical protein
MLDTHVEVTTDEAASLLRLGEVTLTLVRLSI